LKAFPLGAAGAGETQVVVDDFDQWLWPAQTMSLLNQLILPPGALLVVLHLLGCGLADVNERLPAQMLGLDFGGRAITLKTQNGPNAVIIDLDSGSNHNCAIASDRSLFCWGSDNSGQLGDDPTFATKSIPVPVLWSLY